MRKFLTTFTYLVILQLLTGGQVAGNIVAPEPVADMTVPYADGFDLPVGFPHGEGYYRSRGFSVGGHLGDDWNGTGMGDSDFGDPVHAMGHGKVILAQDIRMGYGKTIIIFHQYRSGGKLKQIESLYSHLDKILVKQGDLVKRGQKIGTIGDGNGQYTAHLHFEIRRKPGLGYRGHFKKDFSNFHDPFTFISRHRPPGHPRLELVNNRPVLLPSRNMMASSPPPPAPFNFPARSSNVSPPVPVPAPAQAMGTPAKRNDSVTRLSAVVLPPRISVAAPRPSESKDISSVRLPAPKLVLEIPVDDLLRDSSLPAKTTSSHSQSPGA